MSIVLERLRVLCQTGKSLQEVEVHELHKLVEVIKAFLQDEARRVVRKAQGLPVLRCYSSDTTPVKIKAALPGGQSSSSASHRRVGARAVDPLMQL